MTRERLRLRILGPPASKVRPELALSPLQDRIETPGFLAHAETLACLLGSTINLLVDIVYDGPNAHVPGKLYEYLRAGRPILALSPEGQTSSLIHEAEGGWVVPPGDREALRRTVAAAYEDWTKGKRLPVPRREVAERFDRRLLTDRLAAVMQESVDRARAGRADADREGADHAGAEPAQA